MKSLLCVGCGRAPSRREFRLRGGILPSRSRKSTTAYRPIRDVRDRDLQWPLDVDSSRPECANCVEKLCLIGGRAVILSCRVHEVQSMMGKRRVMQEALFAASASSGMSRLPGAPPRDLSAHGLAITAEIGSDWLARSLRRLLRSGEERAFDQRRLTSQPRDLTACRFRLRGGRFSGNVVALLTSRAALLPRAAQGAFRE